MQLIEDSSESLIYQSRRNSPILKGSTDIPRAGELALTMLFTAITVTGILCIYPYLSHPFSLVAIGLCVGLTVTPFVQEFRYQQKTKLLSVTWTVNKADQMLRVQSKYGDGSLSDNTWRTSDIVLVICRHDTGTDKSDKKIYHNVELITNHESRSWDTLGVFTDSAQAEDMKRRVIDALAYEYHLGLICANDAVIEKEIVVIRKLDLPHAMIGQDMSHLRGKAAVYRGEPLSIEAYRQLYDSLRQQDIHLINTPQMVEAWAAYRASTKLKRPIGSSLVFAGNYWMTEHLPPEYNHNVSKRRIEELIASITEGYCLVEFALDEQENLHISKIADAQYHQLGKYDWYNCSQLYRRIASALQ